MEDIVFTKDDIILLISALTKFTCSTSLDLTAHLNDDVFTYVSDKTFEIFISTMSHCHDLQNRLIDMLNNFD